MRTQFNKINSLISIGLILFIVLASFTFLGDSAFALESNDSASVVNEETTEESSGTSVMRIVRAGGENRYDTTMAVADQLLIELGMSRFSTVVIASGDDYADALSGAFFARTRKAPVLLINHENANKIINYITAKLHKKGKVYILGGPKAVSQSVESRLKSDYNVTRLAGADRYGTNIEILKVLKAEGYRNIAVCSGNSFADALSASALPMPLLLANDKLSIAQTKYLTKMRNVSFKVIGGDKAVSTDVFTGLRPYGQVRRYYGQDRYATASVVANTFFPGKQKTVVLTYGGNYPDGISAGPLAGIIGAPIMLTAKDNPASAYNYIVDAKAERTIVIGGNKVIEPSQVGGTLREGVAIISNSQYYIKSDGHMGQGEWVDVSGKMYHCLESGKIVRITLGPIRGIDVSEFNGIINWRQVKADGISFAFVRVGGRYSASGKIYSDDMAKINIEGAQRAGVKVGVYYFGQSISAKEGREDAEFVLNMIKNYKLELPVVFDSEAYLGGGRHTLTTTVNRTSAIKAFCDRVSSAGLTPMIYSSTSWVYEKLDMSKLKGIPLWIADWRGRCYYNGDYICWQDSDKGKVKGISGYVDTNWWYGGAL